MGLFWGRKRRRERIHDAEATVEVAEVKRQAHETVEAAERRAEELRKILRANGITLKIFVATGGKRNQ